MAGREAGTAQLPGYSGAAAYKLVHCVWSETAHPSALDFRPALLLLLPWLPLLLLLLQEAEVEVLRTLTQPELAAFAQEVLAAGSPARRKVAVLIRGSQEFPAGQQQQQDGMCPAPDSNGSSSGSKPAGDTPAAAAEGAGMCSAKEAEAGVCSSSSSGADDVAYVSTAVPAEEKFLLIRDVSAFKRGCEVWAASQQHSKQHRRQPVLSGQGTAAAAAADAVGEAAAAAQSEEAMPGAAKL